MTTASESAGASGHVYYPDGASYQAGLNLSGWLAAMFKATEGTGYKNPSYADQKNEAGRAGAFFGAYHFLHQGNAVAQADFAFSVVGAETPLMIDFEPTTGAIREMAEPPEGLTGEHLDGLSQRTDAAAAMVSAPAVSDAAAFCDRYRSHGGIVHLIYLPHWYWNQLGSPSLAALSGRSLNLVTSVYAGNPEDPAGPGWVNYGGMGPVTAWQYTSSGTVNGRAGVDLNCFRGSGTRDVPGTLAELRSLWMTGSLAGTPPAPPVAPPPFPYPATDYLGLTSLDPHCHSGYQAADQPHVQAWQQQMSVRGWAIAADGQFGTQSDQVCRAFQSEKNLTADGKVGPLTWAASWTSPVT